MSSSLVAKARARIESPALKKLIKYGLVSVVAIVVTLSVQVITFGLFHWKNGDSVIVASTIAAIPSYYLNRKWVWGKSGRSHMRREVVPFWIMFFVGMAFSLSASSFADHWGQTHVHSHGVRTLVVTGASFFSYGILWFAKFVIFNKILFAHREQELDPALDGRTGLPT